MSDRPNLQERIEIKPGVSHIKAACLSPDNQSIAVGGSNGCVEVYRTENGHCVGSFQPSKPKEKTTNIKINLGGITSLNWVRTGTEKQALCVGTTSGWAALYSKTDDMVRFSTEKERLYEVFPGQAVINAAYDAGRFVFVSNSGRLEGYKHAPPPSNAPWQPLGGRDLSFIPMGIQFADKELLVTSWQEAKLYVIDTFEGSSLHHCRRSLSVAALSSDQDQWNWNKPLDYPIGAPVFSSNKTKILAQRKDAGIYELYKFPEMELLRNFIVPQHLNNVKQCAFLDRDGHFAGFGGDNGYVYIYDTRSGDRVQTLEYQKGKVAVRTILAANSGVREVILAAASDDEYGNLVIWRGTFASPRWSHVSSGLNKCMVSIALTLVVLLPIIYFSRETLTDKCFFCISAL